MNQSSPRADIPQGAGRFKRSGHSFFLITIIICLVIVFLPTVIAAVATPRDSFYTGLHVLTPGDYPVYFSFLEQARQGHFLLIDLFTMEPQARIFFNPVWASLGLLVRVGISPILAFQIGRLVLAPLLLLTVLFLVRRLFMDVIEQRFAFLFTIFASGVGVFAALFQTGKIIYDPATGTYQWPLDLWVPEGFTFLTLLHSPHFLASTLLLFLVFLNVMKFSEDRGFRSAIFGGLAALGLYSIHPFQAVVVVGVTTAYLFFLWVSERRLPGREFVRLIIVHVLSAPGLVYHIWFNATDPGAAVRFSQNLLGNPNFPLLLASYGFLLPLAAVAAGYVFTRLRANRSWTFVAIWAIVQAGLVLAPFTFQRRLTGGLHVALAFLAAFILLRLLRARFPAEGFATTLRRYAWFLPIVIFLFGLSNVYVFSNELNHIVPRSSTFYQPKALAEVAEWLRTQSPEDASVLTDGDTGTLLPGLSGRKVYLGHSIETLFFAEKIKRLTWFFSDEASDADRLAFLQTSGLNYLLITPTTHAFRPPASDQSNDLRLVFERGDFSLYEVRSSVGDLEHSQEDIGPQPLGSKDAEFR